MFLISPKIARVPSADQARDSPEAVLAKGSACPRSQSQKILSEEHFNFVPINQISTEAAAYAPLDPGCCRLLGEAVINEKDQLP